MKEKIGITLRPSTIGLIQDKMRAHRQTNKSHFIEFVLLSYLRNRKAEHQLLLKQRERLVFKLKFINEQILNIEDSFLEDEQESKQLTIAHTVMP